MDQRDILRDAARRPVDALSVVEDRITVAVANEHPAGHPNSITWLLWHTAREVDIQLAQLSSHEQLWDTLNMERATGLDRDSSSIGYGDSEEAARSLSIGNDEQLRALVAYVHAAFDALDAYIMSLGPGFDATKKLSEVIGQYDGTDITQGVRLVSIIDDAAQHMGQISYALTQAEATIDRRT